MVSMGCPIIFMAKKVVLVLIDNFQIDYKHTIFLLEVQYPLNFQVYLRVKHCR